MAAASVNTPIKDTVGATFSAGFDITAKTAIDGRMTVQTTSDLTDSRAWQSKSGTAAAPEYWLYNGLFTSVADTGKLYVLAGIDETLPKTIWPNPAAPGTASSGPRWVEAGGTDSFLKEAYIVDAKYGYVTSSQEYAAYYEPDYEQYDRVYEDRELTTLATEKKYLKMVVTQAGGSGIITNVIYCDVQDLIKNVGRTLTIYGQGVLAASFDGTSDTDLRLTGTENIQVTASANMVNFGLVWQEVVATLGRVTLIHKLNGFEVDDTSAAIAAWGSISYEDEKLVFTKRWTFDEDIDYTFGASYDEHGVPSVLGELDADRIKPRFGKALVGWKCMCSTNTAGHGQEGDDIVCVIEGTFDAERNIHYTYTINTDKIVHPLLAGDDYTITLIAKDEDVSVEHHIDGSQTTTMFDKRLTWRDHGYEHIYRSDKYEYTPKHPDPTDIAGNIVDPTSKWRFTYCDKMYWVSIDGNDMSGGEHQKANSTKTWRAQFGGRMYSSPTYQPGETPSTYDISDDYPNAHHQEVWTYCNPATT